MNIVWVIESGGLSGGVRVILEYATRLAKRGHKCTVASLDYQPNWFDCSGLDWWVFPDYNTMMPHLKTVEAKKVATWWKTAHFLVNGASDGEGYYLVQDIESSYYFRPIEREYVENTYKLGLKMFTPNKWVKDQIPDVAWVGQAYDSNLYKRMKLAYPTKNRVLAIARRQSLKGFSELGELSRRLTTIDKSIEMVTFGRDQVIQLVGAHKNHISNPSDRDVVRLYSEGAVFVSTSQHEGFSLSPLEAMACGCPVSTTDADGNYFCVDGVNCLKFDKHDMVGMAQGTALLLKDKVLQDKLVRGGLETAKEFSNWSEVIDKLEAMFGE